MIRFNTDGIPMPPINQTIVQQWIRRVTAFYGKRVGEINYIFCDDKKILLTNQQYLQHDYFTDVITFDYSCFPVISGDIFISLDTVRSNAEQLNIDYLTELHRVIIHGVLHLSGQADKTEEAAKQMRRKEDHALSLLSLPQTAKQ